MNRLNSEGHDESQYLPKGTPPVNAFRAQHGNVKWEGESIKAMSWMPDILFDKEIISKKHLDTSNNFFRIVVQAKRTLGICDLRGGLFDKHETGAAFEADLFLEIWRSIPKSEFNMLLWFVWDDYNRGNVALAIHLRGTIQHGLENAQKIIDNFSKANDNTESTLPEVSLKTTRPASL